MNEGTLIVFLKAPKAGRVKTRLAREIGAGRAAQVFRHLTTIAMHAAEGPWRTILAVDPAAELRGWRHLWPRRFARVPQGAGDLGARMKRAIDAAPKGPVVVIGADAPGLRAQDVGAAFRALRRHDAAFGPAADGGYYLIGLARRRPAPLLFDGVRWSSATALADTRASLPPSFRIACLRTLRDVDAAADLRAEAPLLLARKVASR